MLRRWQGFLCFRKLILLKSRVGFPGKEELIASILEIEGGEIFLMGIKDVQSVSGI